MTPEILLDSIGIEERSFFHLLIAKQLLKYAKNHNLEDVTSEIIDNIPIMMILLLPIYALFLKLVYFRQNRLYAEHLIFAIHIHTILYFLGIIVLLMSLWFNIKLYFPAWIYITIYAIIMFQRVYKQHWFKTLIKMGILGIMYFFTILIAASFEVLISLLLF